MKEKDLHRKLRSWAYDTYQPIDVKRGTGLIKIFKLSTLALYGEVGWPDQMILIKAPERKGHVFFIELKSLDGECSEIQLQRHAELRIMGFPVYVVNQLSTGKSIIANEVAFALGRKTKPRPTMPFIGGI